MKFSPFYLLFGRESALLISSRSPFSPESAPAEFTSHTVRRAEDARQLARLSTLEPQERQCAHYDDTHQHVTYFIGDLVLLQTPQRRVGLSEKLLPRYNGPYHILREILRT